MNQRRPRSPIEAEQLGEQARPWSPVEITRRAQGAIEARADAVSDLITLAELEATRGYELRKQRAEAYAFMRHMPKDEQPRNAEERRAWVEDRVNDTEYAYQLAQSQYRNQREVIRMFADECDLCRTLLVSHRGVD